MFTANFMLLLKFAELNCLGSPLYIHRILLDENMFLWWQRWCVSQYSKFAPKHKFWHQSASFLRISFRETHLNIVCSGKHASKTIHLNYVTYRMPKVCNFRNFIGVNSGFRDTSI